MARRDSSMAVIEKALASPEAPLIADTGTPIPDLVPAVDNPVPLSGEEEAPPPPGLTEGKADKAIEDQQSERQRLIDAAIAKRQEEKDVFQQNANATVDAVQRIARNTGVTIEKIPSPGSVMLPLLVLLIFVFLLLPVNGHTRLVWLWLVITGNASTGGAAQSPIFSELAINAPPIINPGQSTSNAPPIINPGQQASAAGLSFAGNEHPS